MKILSAQQLAEADKSTIDKQQISSLDLMERVATLIFERIHQRLNGSPVPVKVFCGIGNNGGDGLALARHMIQHGYHVTTYVTNCSKKRTPEFLANYDRIKEVTKEWPTLLSCEEDFPEIDTQDIIIDAIFGTGLNRPIKGWMAQLVKKINESKAFVVSVDMPSGLFANEPNGVKDAIVKANHTFSFMTPKLSFFLADTAIYAGSFEVVNIGLDPEYMMQAPPLAQVITREGAQRVYRPREKYTHKGDFGHVVVLAGSMGKMGAATLACGAAMNSGAGKVTAYIPQLGNNILQTALPEVMTLTGTGIDFISDFQHDLKDVTLCIGPGIGQNDATVNAFAKALQSQKKPVVIDADGLNILAANSALWKNVPENSILTPHDGEFERLVGTWKNGYERIELAKKLSNKHKVILVLKGAHTTTILGDQVYINDSGNPGMATAGSGDVLAGVMAGFLAQGYDPLIAAIFSVYIHGLAGDVASQTYAHEGIKASIISNFIGPSILQLFKQPEQPQQLQASKK
ncbi:MAG: NAD(P)H-hydrate dehydratase [Nonlabens sp.]|nr:NAD(P)H-hydrate dehydratase [Nonlabens sp.]